MAKFYTLYLIRSSSTKKEKESGLLTTVKVLISGGIHIHIALPNLRIIYRKQFGGFLSFGFDI
jgi:hypothetical protein